MDEKMSCYRPARQYLPASIAAAALSSFSPWCGLQWMAALIPAALFALSAATLFYLGTRPSIEVTDRGLRIGPATIPWDAIESVDSTSWNSPLVLRIGALKGRRIRLVYPGDVDSADRLFRQIRRRARKAVIDGIVYRSELTPAPIRASGLRSPANRLLRTEDEQEVERLYQQLKTANRRDAPSDGEESDRR